jgi:hypothetical protein
LLCLLLLLLLLRCLLFRLKLLPEVRAQNGF